MSMPSLPAGAGTSAGTSPGAPALDARASPVTTYRLQLGPGFDFRAAAAVLPYLARLGVTTCYTSPYFTAGRESASGYDVCDPTTFHPELGGAAGFETFARALRAAGLGHMIDIVPNHVGTDEVRNPWWRDVLARGQESPFASFFDIDWRPVKPELCGRLLLPILGTPYGAALEDGDITIRAGDSGLVVVVPGHELPTRLGASGLDPGALSVGAVHELLERQVYRLAYWRTASDEINYRRFFDIDGLAGLRMEEPAVFDAAHVLVGELIQAGIVTSVRVDHPDGLARPGEYFGRLDRLAAALAGRRLHIVAEKILTAGEAMPETWPIDGTTGYEFLNLVGGLFAHPAGLALLRASYARVTGRRVTFGEESIRARMDIMATTMASEVAMLASRLNRISEQHWRSRDFTLNSLRRAIVELVAHMPVYRTYLGDGPTRAEDVARIRGAIATATRRNRALEPSVFRFLEAVMLDSARIDERSEYPAASASHAEARRLFTERLQQFSASVFAKGVEDTACYRHQPLLSLNEVGGAPDAPPGTVEMFHVQNAARAEHASRGLLATATHDTKFGEDTRARMYVLSELAAEWRRTLRRWRDIARRASRSRPDAPSVDENDMYRFYQALVGTWPCGEGDAARPEYAGRLVDFMRKSVREAKQHTSWINAEGDYEAALEHLVRRVIERLLQVHLEQPPPFVRRVARVGVVNSLAQFALKVGSPGVADVYQGAELWDLSLVDPDNRRPVDFERRAAWLETLDPLRARAARADAGTADAVRALLETWPDGRIKLYVTAAALQFRRAWADVFLTGRYEPIAAAGGRPAEIVAFRRVHGQREVLVAAPRFVARMMDQDDAWPLADQWGDLEISLPSACAGRRFSSVLTGESLVPAAGDRGARVAARDLFRACPVGLWRAEA
jgi:(1->4)-alpha-D-glucan 1-alpha-D-glucosylmutase